MELLPINKKNNHDAERLQEHVNEATASMEWIGHVISDMISDLKMHYDEKEQEFNDETDNADEFFDCTDLGDKLTCAIDELENIYNEVENKKDELMDLIYYDSEFIEDEY
ncbi:hypothetical protein [uncultured Mediterranean phage uvMED]|nr:hypothetical protein [uncultured Mediterranean phage uvMED]